MIVKDLLEVFNKADLEADVFVSIFIGDIEIDVDIKDATDLGHAVFIEPEKLYITHGRETGMYIPKKSHNFTFNIFDPDSGETIARNIPLSDKKAKEMFDNYEKIKAEKPKDETADWREEENETNRCR